MNIKNCFLSLIGQFLPLSKSLCLTWALESDRHRVEAASPLPVIKHALSALPALHFMRSQSFEMKFLRPKTKPNYNNTCWNFLVVYCENDLYDSSNNWMVIFTRGEAREHSSNF